MAPTMPAARDLGKPSVHTRLCRPRSRARRLYYEDGGLRKVVPYTFAYVPPRGIAV